MKLKSLFLFGLFSPVISNAQNFYDRAVIQNIEIFFASSTWDTQLDQLAATTEGYLLADSVRINGISYDSVGVKYKGNSSYNASNNKNPLHIKLDYIQKLDYQGYTHVKLQNGYQDPSMIREVLSYAILEQFMDCPKANFANVYINGTLRGMYSNAQSIDDKFLGDHFYDNQGSFFKCNPIGGAGPGGGAVYPDLKYLGSDSSLFANGYELQSTYGWNNLVSLTNTLNNNFTAIENQLDMDRVIWMLAFNNVLVNLDSYSGQFHQNYYLYKDLNERFVPTLWDLNMSFGGFPGGGSTPTTLDPLANASSTAYPLIQKMLGNATYKKMYMAHIRTILTDIFASGEYLTIANSLRSTIDASVSSDPYKFYTYAQFQNSLTTNITSSGGPGGGFTTYGIQNLMSARVIYFQSNTDFNYVAPSIISHTFTNLNPTYASTNTINVSCSGETEVFFGYRFDNQFKFNRLQLFDDGAHNDGLAGDQVYGIDINMDGAQIHYYIYAQNAEAGIFSPQRAEHEFHTMEISVPQTLDNEVVLNELMAKNVDFNYDNYGQDEDWLELFNTTATGKLLEGLYLTNDVANPTKWAFPLNSYIAPNDYFIVWMDDDSTQSGVHSTIKISSTSETLYLSDGITLFDTVSTGILNPNEAWARCPDAGVFTIAVPTFDAPNNCFLTLDENFANSVFNLSIFPVPSTENTTIRLEEDKVMILKVLDMQGREIYVSNIVQGDNLINCANWMSGMYQFVLTDLSASSVKVYPFIKK